MPENLTKGYGFTLLEILPPEAPPHPPDGGSEIDRDALLLPIAKTHRLWPFAAAQFGGQVRRRGGLAAGFGLGQGAPGFGGQGRGGLRHRAFLGKAAPFI